VEQQAYAPSHAQRVSWVASHGSERDSTYSGSTELEGPEHNAMSSLIMCVGALCLLAIALVAGSKSLEILRAVESFLITSSVLVLHGLKEFKEFEVPGPG